MQAISARIKLINVNNDDGLKEAEGHQSRIFLKLKRQLWKFAQGLTIGASHDVEIRGLATLSKVNG